LQNRLADILFVVIMAKDRKIIYLYNGYKADLMTLRSLQEIKDSDKKG